MAFKLDPSTLRAGRFEWVMHGHLETGGPLYVVEIMTEDLREEVPDLPMDDALRAFSIRHQIWEQACEKAISEQRAKPIYEDTAPGTRLTIRHIKIVLRKVDL